MRIAVLGNAASAHTRRWGEAFADRGHEVHVVSVRAAEIPGVTVHRVGLGPAPTRSRILALLSYVRLLRSARRILDRLDPDVVHAHYATTHGVIAARARRRPLVVTVYGSDLIVGDRVRRGAAAAAVRFALGRADAVTAAGRFLAGAAQRFAPDRVHRIPFGVDTAAFAPGPRTAGRDGFTVGFVKHLRRRYGPDVLVDAFARVAAAVPEARLVVAGDGPWRRRLHRRVRRHGLARRVEFLGAVAHRAVPEVMRRLDVLVNPSRSESFGVVMLEAAACGLPVVATRVGGTEETVVDGVTGMLVPPAHPAALADAVVDLASRPEVRQQMGRAGRERVVAEFEWERSVDRMLGLFAEVAGAVP